MNNTTVFDIIEKLQLVKTTNQLKSVCENFRENFQFDHFAFVLIKPTSLTHPDVFIIEDYPLEWVNEYHENNFLKNDPLMGYATEFTQPISWQEVMNLDQFNVKSSRVVIEEAKKYGLNDGLCFSYRSHAGDLAIFSLAIDSPKEKNQSVLKNALMPGKYITAYIYEAALKLRYNKERKENPTENTNFTRREKQCMLWACEGKTAWEISNILDISERTAIFHLNNCTTKLNAANRQHAVAKAVLLGIIKPTFSV